MSAITCTVESCGRPVSDGFACSGCALTLERALGDVRWLDEELDVVLTRQTATGARNGGRSATKPLPYDPRATEARYVLVNTVTTWARVVQEESPGATIPAFGGLGIVAVWLGSYVEWLRHHQAAGEAFDELLSAVDSARRVVDVRPERWYAGPCNAEVEKARECGHDLYAKVGATSVSCPACGSTYDVTARRAWLLEAAHDHLATAREASALCRVQFGDLVTVDMIRGYVRRGKLAQHGSGIDTKGRTVALYRIGDVIDAAQATGYDEREMRATKKAGKLIDTA